MILLNVKCKLLLKLLKLKERANFHHMLFMRDCAMYLWGGGSVGLAELFCIPFVLRGQGV